LLAIISIAAAAVLAILGKDGWVWFLIFSMLVY